MKFNISKLFLTGACAALIAGSPMAADAGLGSSYSQVQTTINNGGVVSIIGELEQAEFLVCPACVEPVLGLLDDERYQVREVAAWWFARRPAEKAMLTERSISRLVSGDSVQVRNSADILGSFQHPQAVPALSSAFNRSDLSVEARAHIAHALGVIGHPSANATLEAAMADESADVRLNAITAWIEIRTQKNAAPALALVLDSNTLVRRKAAAVIGHFRDSAGRVNLETALLNDADPVVRRNAAWSLGRIGDSASLAALDQATSDDSSLVRATARNAKRQLR